MLHFRYIGSALSVPSCRYFIHYIHYIPLIGHLIVGYCRFRSPFIHTVRSTSINWFNFSCSHFIHSLITVKTTLPCGHSALSSIQSPFISLINAERMKCGLNWSESGPVPLRSCGTKSINLSFLSLKELDWFDCSCLLPCARRYSALRLLYVRLPLPSSFTYSSWLRKHPSLLTVHFTFIKLN